MPVEHMCLDKLDSFREVAVAPWTADEEEVLVRGLTGRVRVVRLAGE